MLLPYLLGLVGLIVIPTLLALGLAFTRYDGLSLPRWIGLRNFTLFFADLRFWAALKNSLFYAVIAVPLRGLGALALALLLNQPRRGVGLYRAAVYLPTVIPDVAYALIWLWVFNPLYGPLNIILMRLGLPAPAWLVDPVMAKPALIFMSLFQIGEGFVILLAGLQTIPREVLESAIVDGGNRWQVVWHVILPLLKPWLALLTVRDLIMSLQNTFTPALIMTGGGPYYATLFLNQLAYEEAFDGFRFGQGAAIILLIVVISAALLGGLWVLVQRWGDRSDE
jgi:multiple sugar transport system permease protein